MATDPTKPVLLYDGVCALCGRLVRFSLERDSKRRLRFASLQSGFAARVLRRHALEPGDLDTVYFIEAPGQPDEHLVARSDAVISVLQQLGGPWKVAAALFRGVPRWLRDRAYAIVARNRYRIFGRSDVCPMPDAKYQDRFLDL